MLQEVEPIEDIDVIKSKNEFKAVFRLEKFSDRGLLVFVAKVSEIV